VVAGWINEQIAVRLRISRCMVAAHLEHILGKLGVAWEVRSVSDRLVNGPADLTDLISAARRRLIDEQRHLTVCITDLPLQTARRPVIAHASMTPGVAVLSLGAIGVSQLGIRATRCGPPQGRSRGAAAAGWRR
jgi:hypothetical protein